MRIGVLGGGLTGLTLASLLDHEVEVLEKEAECGGLCRTLTDDGFTFDYGGCHILFSRDESALNFMLDALGPNKERNRRNNKVLYGNRYVKYPFENGLGDLSPQDNFDCLYGFIQAQMAKSGCQFASPRDFKEWCYQTFGSGIAEKYMIPYNEKIWKFPAQGLNATWVSDRVPQPPLEDVIKSALGIQTEGYTHQLYYHYPRQGGVQALIEALKNSIRGRIVEGYSVTNLAKGIRGWNVSDGKNQRTYDRVVSTIPLFELAKAVGGIPGSIRDALSALHYNRLITVIIGVDRPHLNDLTALYIPDRSVLSHRLGFISNFSPCNAPVGKCSVMAEITCAVDDNEIWNSKENTIITRVIDDLTRLGILQDRNAVCYSKAMRSEYAYVVNDLDYLRNVSLVKDYFGSMGIILAGRFSEFEYLNMDACVRRAMTIAAQLNSDA